MNKVVAYSRHVSSVPIKTIKCIYLSARSKPETRDRLVLTTSTTRPTIYLSCPIPIPSHNPLTTLYELYADNYNVFYKGDIKIRERQISSIEKI